MLTSQQRIQQAARRAAARVKSPGSTAHPTYSDPVAFIESQFYVPEMRPTDPPAMELHDYQRAVLHEAYRTDADGKFIYDVVVWGDIKKSIKSCIAAAVMLHRALESEWGSFKVIANDLQQADSRVFYYIRRALELNKDLGKRATIRNYRISLDNHAQIHAIPVDPKGEAGGNDDLIEWTELHAANGKAADAMWSEMTLSPTKHGYSQRWIDTYAGHVGESPTLERLYDLGVVQGERLQLPNAPDDLEVYANGKLLVLWNTRPRLKWQTDEYYASEAATLTPDEFERMHRNQWMSSANAFVYPAWWDACKGSYPDFTGKPLVAAMDAGVSDDCFAIVAGHLINGVMYPRFTRIWTPPRGGKIQYSNPLYPDDEDTPEGYLRRLKRDLRLMYVTYDAYQLHDFASRLEMELSIPFDAFNQGKDRAIADKQLYDTIRDGRIIHDGDAALSEHVKNANRKAGDADTLRIIKRAHHLKIDACVALSMLNHVCREVLIL